MDLTSRLIVLRLRQGGVGASDLIIVDLNVVSNDAQSQTTLLITQVHSCTVAELDLIYTSFCDERDLSAEY